MKFWPAIRLTAAAIAATLSVGLFVMMVAQGTGLSYCPPWLAQLPVTPGQMLAAAAAIFLAALVAVVNRGSP